MAWRARLAEVQSAGNSLPRVPPSACPCPSEGALSPFITHRPLYRPGGAYDISAGADGSVWATASGGTYLWTGGTSTTSWPVNWTLVPGSAPGGSALLAQASGRSSTDLWGVDSSGNVWHYNGSSWTQSPGPGSSMVWVSEGADGTVYGVDSSDSTWRYTGSGWTPGSGPLTQLSVGTSTHIWGVDSHDNIWSTTVSTVL
jgi:virginiamycin B lyase